MLGIVTFKFLLDFSVHSPTCYFDVYVHVVLHFFEWKRICVVFFVMNLLESINTTTLFNFRSTRVLFLVGYMLLNL